MNGYPHYHQPIAFDVSMDIYEIQAEIAIVINRLKEKISGK